MLRPSRCAVMTTNRQKQVGHQPSLFQQSDDAKTVPTLCVREVIDILAELLLGAIQPAVSAEGGDNESENHT